jgi:hypothetical protein
VEAFRKMVDGVNCFGIIGPLAEGRQSRGLGDLYPRLAD